MNNETNTTQNEIEMALEAERREAHDQMNKAQERQSRVARLGSGLRFIGVMVLVAAVATFMSQRWTEMSHLTRYFSFLGFTAFVCGAGLLCGLKIGESKGARTLLGAVVTFIPVHCAQLGAILYSRAAQSAPSELYPSYLYWSVPSLTQAILALSVGLLALAPMAYMAYSVLSRRFAKTLFTLGFATSSALLLPTRDPLIVGLLISVVAVCMIRAEVSFSGIVELKTKEAIVARAVPMLALLTIVGRQAALYDTPRVFVGVLFALLSAVLFEVMPRVVPHKRVTGLCEVASMGTVAIAALMIADGLMHGFQVAGAEFEPLLYGLPIALSYALMAERARLTGSTFRVYSALALLLTGGAELCMYGSLASSVFALVIGIGAVTIGCLSQQRAMLFVGAGLTLLALVKTTAIAFSSLYVSAWIVMGVLGIVTIVGASYLERNFLLLRERLFAFRQRMQGWR